MLKNIGTAILIFCLTALSAGAAFAADGASNDDLLRARELSKSVNAFAFDLYKEIAKEEKGSIFFSPLSISMALALAYEGAAGETREEMRRVLHYDDNVGKQFRAYLNVLNNTTKKSGEFLLANAAWLDIHLNIREKYVDTLKKYYDSKATKIDYSDTHGAAEAINLWCYRNTKGKIKKIVVPGDLKGCRLALGNAAYFKAEWQRGFRKERTAPMPFHRSEKEVVEYPMMKTRGNYKYYEDKKIQSLTMPYKDGIFAMIAILPKEIRYMKKIEKELGEALLSKILSCYDIANVNLCLPRFMIEENYQMAYCLRAIGMNKALSSAANFSGITGMPGLYIDKVIHKAIAGVTEEGSEAAATTVIIMNKILPPPGKRRVIEFTADRPFLFFILDNRTNTIMFMGKWVGE